VTEHNDRQRSSQRDLQLVLLGVAFTKGDRQRVLDAITPEHCCAEIGKLMAAIKASDIVPIRQWLEDHDTPIADGNDVIQSLIDSVHRYCKRASMKNLAFELNMARIEDTPELIERLRNMADDLEGTL